MGFLEPTNTWMTNTSICYKFEVFTQLILPIGINRMNGKNLLTSLTSFSFFLGMLFWENPHALMSQPCIEEHSEKLKLVWMSLLLFFTYRGKFSGYFDISYT